MHAKEGDALQVLASLETVFLREGVSLEGLTPLPVILGQNRPPSFGDWIAGELTREIIRGDMKSGSAVREIELATRFRTSRTPVREAIRLLASYGLLDEDSHRSHVVRRLSPAELSRISEARLAIEPAIARLVAVRLNGVARTEIEALRPRFESLAESGDRIRFMALFPRFTFLKLLAAGNMYLTAMYTTIAHNVARIWFLSVEDEEPLERKCGRLLAQIDAFLDGDSDAAAAAMSTSVRHSWASLQTVNGAKPDTPRTFEELAGQREDALRRNAAP